MDEKFTSSFQLHLHFAHFRCMITPPDNVVKHLLHSIFKHLSQKYCGGHHCFYQYFNKWPMDPNKFKWWQTWMKMSKMHSLQLKVIPVWRDKIKATASVSGILSLLAMLGSHQPTNITFFKWLKAPARMKDKGNSRETSVCLTDRKPGFTDCKVVLELVSATPSQCPWSALQQQNSSLRS